MKLNPVTRNFHVPAAKCCVHRDEITAVVSGTDCVYLYTGGKEGPWPILTFNPKSGQAIHVDEKWGTHNFFLEELEGFAKAREMYGKGLRLLAAANYFSPQSQEQKLREWIDDVLARPSVSFEELKAGHCVVAIIGSQNTIHMGCRMLGDYIKNEKGIHFFQVQKDPDLEQGVWVTEQENRKVHVVSSHLEQCGVNERSDQVKRLTREDAEWLRALLPPAYPLYRYLNVHKEMLEEGEREKQRRERAIVRGARLVAEKRDTIGTVEI